MTDRTEQPQWRSPLVWRQQSDFLWSASGIGCVYLMQSTQADGWLTSVSSGKVEVVSETREEAEAECQAHHDARLASLRILPPEGKVLVPVELVKNCASFCKSLISEAKSGDERNSYIIEDDGTPLEAAVEIHLATDTILAVHNQEQANGE